MFKTNKIFNLKIQQVYQNAHTPGQVETKTNFAPLEEGTNLS